MLIDNLCAPALMYLIYSLTQIIIDIFKEMYNTAFLKFIVMIIFTILLNILCSEGLGLISWIIVFIPFIFMTLITSMLLFTFGLTPTKGKIKDYETKYYEPERFPSSYNIDNGELLNNYYEEIHLDNKVYHRHHTKDKHHKHKNQRNINNDYKKIRNKTDKLSEEYYEEDN